MPPDGFSEIRNISEPAEIMPGQVLQTETSEKTDKNKEDAFRRHLLC